MATENPKKYDQAFKSLSDRSPRELLDVFGVLPIEEEAQVEALPRDLSMRPLAIDTAYMIRRLRGQSYTPSSRQSPSGNRNSRPGSPVTGDRLA